ncbi:IkappaB kinase complex, IKAP component [Artomyces pyxidatus]|uniref:IkappaB kinase complex, IKAP component n=1 Tax=Artomyces pyxidatus TaxID=48021 RepID=A0ACB8SZG0_9AGAM|nr:IkappaB kinase complex, IKAP component [Artomyces pyxidatus]
MRNLALLNTEHVLFAHCNVTATAVDLDDGSLWIASERLNADADLEIEIYKQKSGEASSETAIDWPAPPVAMFTSAASHSVPDSASQVVSLRIVSEEQSLVVITRGGDIATMKVDEQESTFDVVGSVEDGLMAAAWSPDDSLLALVTGDGKLIIMTPTFDVLHEAPLHTDDFGEDAPINVGWGSKQTQFHGSLGKAAAQAASTSIAAPIGSSPDDDTLPRISWRGDGTLFAVSSLSRVPPSSPDVETPLRRRVLRIYSRDGSLQSTSEPVAGLEHPISWRPSGNLIVGTQRFGTFRGAGQGKEGRHDVVFFEKNGLRHGEFGLRRASSKPAGKLDGSGKSWEYKVREVCWSSDSNVLAVWIEEDSGDVVQLWTMGNYHWYLKHEVAATSTGTQPARFTSVSWHPENALQLLLTTKTQVIHRTYHWDTYVSRAQAPNDTGTVAVIDGASILLTPFRTQNVPPPMSSFQLSLQPPDSAAHRTLATPIHVSFSPSEDVVAVLWETGRFEIWKLATRIGPGRGPIMTPTKLGSGTIETLEVPSSQRFRQISVWTSPALFETEGIFARVALLGYSSEGSDVLRIVVLGHERITELKAPLLESVGWGFGASDELITCHRAGNVYEVDLTSNELVLHADFGKDCESVQTIQEPSHHPSSPFTHVIGITSSGTLMYSSSSPSSTPRTLSTKANSFVISDDLVIFTTTLHEAHFISFGTLSSADVEDGAGGIKGERRRVERGSRIVTAVSSAMSLVLQMPRGNLETINPRPMVMKVVRRDIDALRYGKAFLACRKHRIDLNVLFDHDPALFRSNLHLFIEQVEDVDYINLFLTSIGNGTQTQSVIAELCDAIRIQLETRDLKKYVNSILTAYVVKRPPDLKAGLQVLLRLRDTEPSIVEDAVKYIIFLVDADTLFDVALGMYDFSLVLMIAQHAQKDPREYLPFLRELRALETHYQHFRIDDHLKRYESALRNLNLAGSDHFEEAMTYVERHQLYESALSIWSESDHLKTVLSLYGDWLFERRDFRQAAAVFIEAERNSKAMVAYEKALMWRELFELALHEKTEEDDLIAMGYRVAEDLTSKKRYLEASQVLLDYSKDIREAVIALVQGNAFSEARRIIVLRSRSELLEEIVHPGTLETRAQIAEELHEIRDQLRKQTARLRELRVRKVEEPDAFYGTEDTALHNVDVMTDVSQFTAFTRYTVAPSTASRTSKRSSRSKRKMERKVGSGRKGTIDEEEYLLKSITKLMVRFSTAQADDASNLIPQLLQFTPAHRDEARSLQQELTELEQEVARSLDDAWPKPSEDVEGEEPQDSWASRMAEKEKDREQAVKNILRPDLRGTEVWRMRLLDVTSGRKVADESQLVATEVEG